MNRVVAACLTVLGMYGVLCAAYTEGHYEQTTVAGGYGTSSYDVKVYPSESQEYDIGGFGDRDVYVCFKDNEDWTNLAIWSGATDGAWSLTVFDDQGTQVYRKTRLTGNMDMPSKSFRMNVDEAWYESGRVYRVKVGNMSALGTRFRLILDNTDGSWPIGAYYAVKFPGTYGSPAYQGDLGGGSPGNGTTEPDAHKVLGVELGKALERFGLSRVQRGAEVDGVTRPTELTRDLNSDGKPDMAALGYSTESQEVWLVLVSSTVNGYEAARYLVAGLVDQQSWAAFISDEMYPSWRKDHFSMGLFFEVDSRPGSRGSSQMGHSWRWDPYVPRGLGATSFACEAYCTYYPGDRGRGFHGWWARSIFLFWDGNSYLRMFHTAWPNED
jgi:hypothetical protein